MIWLANSKQRVQRNIHLGSAVPWLLLFSPGLHVEWRPKGLSFEICPCLKSGTDNGRTVSQISLRTVFPASIYLTISRSADFCCGNMQDSTGHRTQQLRNGKMEDLSEKRLKFDSETCCFFPVRRRCLKTVWRDISLFVFLRGGFVWKAFEVWFWDLLFFFLCEGVVLKRFEETLVCLFFFAEDLSEKRLKFDSETCCIFFLFEGDVLKRFEETSLVCLFFFAEDLSEKRLKFDSENCCFFSCAKALS